MNIADRVPFVVTALGALSLLATGAWAFLWPENFYDEIAPFPPYNQHFMHDIGAFQIGLGAALLLALRARDAMFVVLAGVGSGAALHAVAHVIDRDEGGRSSDPYTLGVLAALLLIGAALRWGAATRDA